MNPNNDLQQRPLARYANDPTGFFTQNAEANESNWKVLFPSGHSPAIDRNVLRDRLAKVIQWLAISVRWGDYEFPASVADAQMDAPLEAGGFGVSGQVVITFSKSPFFTGTLRPQAGDQVEILAGGEWRSFSIQGVTNGFDEGDDTLIAYASPVDLSNANGYPQ